MKNIKITTFIIVAIYLILFLFAPVVRADIPNPEFSIKKCKSGEKEIVCSYKSEKPFGPHTEDECLKYKDNPNYYYLVSQGSSFGGEMKYCLKAGANESDVGKESDISTNNNYSTVGIAIIAITAISLLALFIIRRKYAN